MFKGKIKQQLFRHFLYMLSPNLHGIITKRLDDRISGPVTANISERKQSHTIIITLTCLCNMQRFLKADKF